MPRRKDDEIEIDMRVHGESDLAILASETGDEDDAVWLPKSQIDFADCDVGDTVAVTIPGWLAKAKGIA